MFKPFNNTIVYYPRLIFATLLNITEECTDENVKVTMVKQYD